VKFAGADEQQPPSNASADRLGDHNQVEVFMGDSIREFKSKLTQACADECAHWKKNKGDASKEAQAYADVVIGHSHVVTVFVPSAKVTRLHAQDMHKSEEYKIAYEQAKLDPSCWQPLDPARTFAQYPQFGFGRGRAQMLRVVEATEAYKLNNLRYKEFDQDMNKRAYMDIDDGMECFGWAKYAHAIDADASGEPTVEWRPCLASKKTEGQGATSCYTVKWCFPPAKTGGRQLPGADKREPHPKQWVLLKPRCPLFDDSVHPAHEEFLEQATILRSSGKSDFEVAQTLGKLLDDKFAKDKSGVETERPPPITVDVVKAYIQRNEMEAAKATATNYGSSAASR